MVGMEQEGWSLGFEKRSSSLKVFSASWKVLGAIGKALSTPGRPKVGVRSGFHSLVHIFRVSWSGAPM